MDKSYITLFTELAGASERLAEQVMALDREKNDVQGEKTAQIMRDDYAQLTDKLKNEVFPLTHNDFAKLLVATFIVSNNLEDRIKQYQASIDTYKLNIIPKLQRIIDETKNDEEVEKLANEIFIINSEN